jgi:hypothetical protein
MASIDNIRLWLRSKNPDVPATRNGQPLALAYSQPVSAVTGQPKPDLRLVEGAGPAVEPGKGVHATAVVGADAAYLSNVIAGVIPMERPRKHAKACAQPGCHRPATETVKFTTQPRVRVCYPCAAGLQGQPPPDAGHSSAEALSVIAFLLFACLAALTFRSAPTVSTADLAGVVTLVWAAVQVGRRVAKQVLTA